MPQHEPRQHQRQPPEPTRNSPQRREGWSKKSREREREVWAEENEKKGLKPGAPDRSKQIANTPLGRKTRTARKATGTRATRPPTGT